MSGSWRRSEPRVVRPFFAADRAKDAAAQAQLRLFEGAQFGTESSHYLDELEMRRVRITVRPNLAPIGTWLPNTYSGADFCLVVLLGNAFLKNSEVVFRLSLDEELPEEIPIPAIAVQNAGGPRNLDVEIALCLSHDRRAKLGLPYLGGQWLSRKLFTIRERITIGFFDVQPRSDAEWLVNGFPPKTLYAVDYLSAIADPWEEGLKIAAAYVHSDAYNAMVTNEQIGRLLQPLLAAEMTVQILEDSLDEWKDFEEVVPTSALSTVLKKLATADSSLDFAKLKMLAASREWGKVRGLLQQVLGSVRTVVEG
jgi:hypothetical protein